MGTFEAAQEMAINAYVSVTGQPDKSQLSPAIIALIIEVAMNVAQNCLKSGVKPVTLLDVAKSRNILARFMIRRAMKDMPEHNKEDIINSVLSMGSVASIEQLVAFTKLT
jgi:hypothetical protein